ncbi:Inositol 2-dehydrogenase/D-chiro-inositol 3-dehydrogenase [Shimia sp. SK013]|uniref:Gfo/Idh/MocA family protein n=1 Tax=Shimia sp. SK013 TaxID=1389006 RepID=UPI0006B5A640|nr:Gfo/Idh/MocA family oxidoreductase [Shimia sp. SK013]KPA22597.1 Inositol 2-dehydrogenase/D-chiro-inositol 3-dehydrogenase [Shimia sp. SK013]
MVIAVIGAGSIGRRHFANLEALGEKAELIGWRGFDQVAFEARDDIEAVVIATSTPIRLSLIEMCADKGWPFYAEKPLAWRVAQAEAIHDAGQAVADRSMVGFMMRYHPAVRDLAARDLSQVYGFHFEIGHDVRQWRENWSFAGSYAAEPEGGGVLMDLSHEIDLALAVLPGLHLQAVDSVGHTNFPEVDFATRLHLASPSGAVGSVAMDYVSPVSLRRAGLRGRDEVIDLDFLKPEMRVESGADTKVTPYVFDRNDMFVEIMRDFVALVRGQKTSENPLMPRFDRMRDSSLLIAKAWETRRFNGAVDMDMS